MSLVPALPLILTLKLSVAPYLSLGGCKWADYMDWNTVRSITDTFLGGSLHELLGLQVFQNSQV